MPVDELLGRGFFLARGTLGVGLFGLGLVLRALGLGRLGGLAGDLLLLGRAIIGAALVLFLARVLALFVLNGLASLFLVSEAAVEQLVLK